MIPPAWKNVWICPYPNGHIQAIGTDAAGRRQYLYHERWQAARSEEKTCPGMQAEILASIADVTPKVAAAGAGLAGEALVKARTAVTSTLEKDACAGDAKYRCQVVDLYHGGQFKLYKYRKYSDVRLVFSPGI